MQLTEVGVSGASSGRSAACAVEVESNIASEYATTPPRQMGARTALGNILRIVFVTQSLVRRTYYTRVYVFKAHTTVYGCGAY